MANTSFKILWDRKALDSFKDVLVYLEKQDKQAPHIVKTAILTRLEVIRKNPLIYEADKLKDPSDSDFRAFVVFSYRVTYQIKIEERVLRILRIRHTSREPLGY